jgi:hemolysin D
MKSAKAVATTGRNARDLRRQDERAFLPAALEIAETPPSPIGRAISLTIIAIFCLAVAWASIGEVDIVASATGKIVPTGRTKIIQAFETGVVRAIHVQDGDRVKAGDLLVELDATVSDADRDHLQSDLLASQTDAARLRASLVEGDALAAFVPPEGASPTLIATERQILTNQVEEQRAKLAAVDRQHAQKQAERDSAAATIAKLEATIPILQQRVDIRKYLADREYGSKLTYLETLTDLVERQKDLVVQRSHVQEAEAALAGTAEQRAQAISEYRRTRFAELAAAEQKAAGLTQDLIKAKERGKLQLITAPVDGVVQQLALHTVGGVVTPAQPLLAVVPADSGIEVEAMVSNRDVGFIRPGQEAEIKVDTFSFTKYGLLGGRVESVSADAVTNNKPAGAAGMAGPDSASEARGQDLDYVAHVSLDRTQMEVDGRAVNLSPGMAVTVEIKTGSRRVISYLLSPFLRFRQESLRER